MKTASGSRFAGVLLAAFALTAGGCSPAAVPTPSPGPRTAIEACRLPANAEKGGQTLTFGWKAWVEEDQSDVGVVFAVSGLNDVICEASRNPDGSFGSSAVGLGGLGPAEASELTYDGGIAAAPTAPRIVVAGRAPAGTAQVEVASGDLRGTAALRDGLYVARLQTSQPVTEVVAMGVDGQELGRLTDPNGLVAGAASSWAKKSPAPSASPALTPTSSGLSALAGPWSGLRWAAPTALPDGTSRHAGSSRLTMRQKSKQVRLAP